MAATTEAPVLTLRLIEIKIGQTSHSYITSVLDPQITDGNSLALEAFRTAMSYRFFVRVGVKVASLTRAATQRL